MLSLAYRRKTHFYERVLLLWRQVNVSEEQCIVLQGKFSQCTIITGVPRTLYNACSITGNVSSSRLAGYIPITSRPKSPSLDFSTDGGKGKGIKSIVMGMVVWGRRVRRWF